MKKAVLRREVQTAVRKNGQIEKRTGQGRSVLFRFSLSVLVCRGLLCGIARAFDGAVP